MWWVRAGLGLVVAALVALVGLEAVAIRNLQRRVAALEAEPSAFALPGPTVAGARPGVAGATPADEEARTARREAFDAALKERIEAVLADSERQREDERGSRFQELVDAQVDEWAAAERVDAATAAKVKEELRRRGEQFRAMRQDLRDGAITFAEAREELEASREESDAALQRLLGPERFASLQDEVLARMGPPGPPGGPGAGAPPPL